GQPLLGLPGVGGQHPGEEVPHPQDLLGLDLDVAGLPLHPAERLVQEHPGVGQGEPLAPGPGGQQDGGGRCGLAEAEGGHVRLDVLHRVVDGEQRGDVAAGRVDVQVDVLVRLLRLQEQQLGAHQVGHGVVDGGAEEDDPFLQQPGVQVVRPLPAVGRLDHGGHQVVGGPEPVVLHAGHSSASPSVASPWSTRSAPSAVPPALSPPVPSAPSPSAPSSSASPAPSSAPWSTDNRSRDTGLPSSSTTSTWSSNQVRAFALRCSERTAAVRPAWASWSRSWSTVTSIRLAIAASSVSSSSSVTSRASASASARSPRSAFTDWWASPRMPATRSSPVWPVAPRNWSMLIRCSSRRWLRSWTRWLTSWSTSTSGTSASSTSSTSDARALSRRAI